MWVAHPPCEIPTKLTGAVLDHHQHGDSHDHRRVPGFEQGVLVWLGLPDGIWRWYVAAAALCLVEVVLTNYDRRDISFIHPPSSNTIVLTLQYGGQTHPWDSILVTWLLAGFGAILATFESSTRRRAP